MRVLLWAASYPPSTGGVQVITEGLGASLADRGHVVEVVTDSGSAEYMVDEGRVRVHRLGFHHALTARDPDLVAETAGRVAGIRTRLSPDVENLHALHPGWFFQLRGAPTSGVVFTSHGWSDVAMDPGSLAGRVIRSADRIACCGQFVADAGRRLLPDVDDRIVMIRNGVRPFPVDDSVARASGPHLVYASRLEPHKGVGDLLDAVEVIHAQVPGLRVTLFGTGSLEEEVRDRIAVPPLAGRVSLRGAVEPAEVRRHMAAATAVVVPSRLPAPAWTADAFPLVAAEAAMLGRPVITTRSGGLPEIVLHGETGVLVEPGDPEDLARGIVSVLADPDRAERLGREARRYAAATCGWDRYVAAYEDIYREVTARR